MILGNAERLEGTTLSDLISRAALLKYFSFSSDGVKYRLKDCDNFPTTVHLEEVQKAIRNAPTVEAALVVHGKWIDLSKGANPHFMCSACSGSLDIENTDTRYPYCPNCAAKMDL